MPNKYFDLNVRTLFNIVCLTALTVSLSSLSERADAARPSKNGKKSAKVLPKKKAVSKTAAADATPNLVVTEPSGPDEDLEQVTRKSALNVDANNAIRLNYGKSAWNTSATQVDSAKIFMREGSTGKIVQIELEETAPDSGIFSGTYSINWKQLEDMRAEFYAPPKKLLDDVNGRMKISQMLESKELRRLPIVMRKDPMTGLQNIELFDDVDQARAAYRSFKAENELLVALKNQTEKRDQTLDTAALAVEKAEREEAIRNAAERARMRQAEVQKLAQKLQEFTLASPQERARRKREAQSAVDQAASEFRAGRFNEARAEYEKAIDLDPSNRAAFNAYGTTLYRLDDFNRALVYLDLADEKSVNKTERDFYRGLSLYRLKDSNGALIPLAKVVAAKDPNFSASARFYSGLIHFEKKRWADARTDFQGVLDESSDPALDERAEAYLENILRQQQFEAERARRWSLSGTFGLIQDDNVLVASDSDRDRGAATNLEAYRMLLVGSARYRAKYEETEEFAVQLDFMTMYSINTSFESNQTLANADPTVIGLTLPWTHKGVFLGKGHKFDFIPGIEATYMSIEDNSTKMIYNSYVAGFQNLFVINESWFTNVNVDLRRDTSLLRSSTGDDDSTALKSKITWSNINFLTDKKQLVVSDLAYTSNNSLGKNSVFNRIDAGVGYIRPAFWDMTFNSKLSYFLLTYPENATKRVDNSYTMTVGLSRKVNDLLTAGLTTSYNFNNSNVSANQYKKLTTMLTLSANKAF